MSLATLQTKDSLKAIWNQLRDVIDREIANASRSLTILRRDPRIGLASAMVGVYDLDMVEQKLEQCRHVRDAELPRVESFLRFHLWQNLKSAEAWFGMKCWIRSPADVYWGRRRAIGIWWMISSVTA